MTTIPAGAQVPSQGRARTRSADATGIASAGAGRTCSALSSRCQGGPARPFRDPLDRRQTTFVLCTVCVTALNAMGGGLVAA